MAKNPFSRTPDLQADERLESEQPIGMSEQHELIDDQDEDITKGASPKGLIKSISKFAIPFLGLGVVIWLFLPDPQVSAPIKKDAPEKQVDTELQAANTDKQIEQLKAEADQPAPTTTRKKEIAQIDPRAAESQDYDAAPRTQPSQLSADLQRVQADLEKRMEEIRASGLEAGGLKLISDVAPTQTSSKLDDLQQELLNTSRMQGDSTAKILSDSEKLAKSISQGPQAGQPKKSTNEAFADTKEADASNYKMLQQQQAFDGPVIFEGTVVRAVLLTAMNSDMPGKITAQVTSNVYDSVRQSNVLIPKGSKLIGEYNSDVAVGQERILVAMKRLILPDGTWISLAGSLATDTQGRSGIEADVNNHFFKMFGASLIIGASSYFMGSNNQQTTVTNANGTTTSGSVLSGSLSDTVNTIMARNKNIAPTLTTESGQPFNFIVAHDMAMRPYTGHF